MEIIAGQIWAYVGVNPNRADPGYHLEQYEAIPDEVLGKIDSLDYVELAVKVIDVDIGEVTCETVRTEGCGWLDKVGDLSVERLKDFEENYRLLINFTDSKLTNKCITCGAENKYIKPTMGYRCWGCRNGY